jgi:hypothetical protein
MVQYLYFRILEFLLTIGLLKPSDFGFIDYSTYQGHFYEIVTN